MTAVAAQTVPQTTSEIEHDWRFAELVARSWTDQDLAIRYDEDPRSVLADFELRLDSGADVPPLPTDVEDGLLIEDLDQYSATVLPTGFCSAGLAAEDVTDPHGV
jgi:hypothetical protein